MKLEHGKKYAAELDLPHIPFVNVKTKAIEKLIDAGFDCVRVWDASDGKTYAEGVWIGSTQEFDQPLDPHIKRWWPV